MFIELAIVLITLLVYYAFKLKRTCATYWQNQGVKVMHKRLTKYIL